MCSSDLFPSHDIGGRFLVPKRLTDLIGSPKEVVMLGVDRKIEIWDHELYGETKTRY